jgi:hypothetical protein
MKFLVEFHHNGGLIHADIVEAPSVMTALEIVAKAWKSRGGNINECTCLIVRPIND